MQELERTDEGKFPEVERVFAAPGNWRKSRRGCRPASPDNYLMPAARVSRTGPQRESRSPPSRKPPMAWSGNNYEFTQPIQTTS